MSYLSKLIVLFSACFMMSCGLKKGMDKNITQGVQGQVVWLEGNLMPSPEAKNLTTGRPIEREILIYRAVTLDQVSGEPPLFSRISAELVQRVKSNANGDFKCSLPPGIYSVFTLEPQGMMFANSFNGQGFINAIKILPGELTKMKIEVNYKAAY